MIRLRRTRFRLPFALRQVVVIICASHLGGSVFAQDATAASLLDAISRDEVTAHAIVFDPGIVQYQQLCDRLRSNPIPAIEQVREFLTNEDDYAKELIALNAVRASAVGARDVMTAVAPDLLHSDREVRKAAEDLARIFVPSGRGGRDFSHIAGLLVEDNAERNEQLIFWAMRTDPQAAIWDFARRLVGDSRDTYDRWREIAYAQHVIADSLWLEDLSFIGDGQMTPEAASQLDLLAASPEWWVRLYVVEVMLRHDFTATPARLAILCADPDLRVAERVASLCPAAP